MSIRQRLILFTFSWVGLSFQPALCQSLPQLDASAREALRQGRFEDAALLARQIYDARVQSAGHNNADTALAAFNVAIALQRAKRPVDAVPFYEEACATAARQFGPENARVGQCLMQFTEALAEGKLPEAEATAARAIAVIEKGYPPDGYAAALFHAGEIFRAAEKIETALDYFARAAAKYEPAALNLPDFLASSLSEQAEILQELHREKEAFQVLGRSVALLRARQPVSDPNLVSKVYLLSRLASTVGEYDRALSLLQEVATQLEAVKVESHVATEDILMEIARLERDNGGSSEAIATSTRVVERLRRGGVARAQERLAGAWRFLAETYRMQQDMTNADDAYRHALTAEETLPDKSSEDLSNTLAEYGFFLMREGRYAEARTEFDRSFELVERAHGADSTEVAGILARLGASLVLANDRASAKPLLERARKIYERGNPATQEMVAVLRLLAACETEHESPEAIARDEEVAKLQEQLEGVTAGLLIEKANISRKKKDLPNARKLLQLALVLEPNSAIVRDTLASVFEAEGQQGEATALLRESIGLAAQAYGADSINVGARYSNLGRNLLLNKDESGAQEAYLSAATRFSKHASQLFANLSLAEQRLVIPQEITSQTTGLLSSCQKGDALVKAYDLLIGWKGFLVGAIAREAAFTTLASDPALKTYVERWKTLRTQLASWSLNRAALPVQEWQAKYDALTADKEKVERALATRAPQRTAVADLAIESVRTLLRPHEVFVDIYQYDQIGPMSGFDYRYAAIVIGSSGGPTFIPLGAAKDLDGALSDWLSALYTPGDAAWRKLAAKIWLPIRSAMPPDTRAVRISPDGALVRVPWHAFGDLERVGSLDVVEVDSARSLLRARQAPLETHFNRLFLVGGLDYDAGRTPDSPGKPGAPFRNLLWARREAAAIDDLARSTRLPKTWLRDGSANKKAVIEGMSASSFLHFSTHGFVGGEADVGFSGRSWVVVKSESGDYSSRNPLVQSGIAISGANVRVPGTLEPTGILTAEELIGINLAGARLVVLSACETGLGVGMTGQGFLGLRSAISAAGAQTLIVSLWRVDDEATQILMRTFYKKVWVEKKPISLSLHEAQDAVRRDRRYKAPRFWAGWSIIGDPE